MSALLESDNFSDTYVVEWETWPAAGKASYSGARAVPATSEKQAIERGSREIAASLGIELARIKVWRVTPLVPR